MKDNTGKQKGKIYYIIIGIGAVILVLVVIGIALIVKNKVSSKKEPVEETVEETVSEVMPEVEEAEVTDEEEISADEPIPERDPEDIYKEAEQLIEEGKYYDAICLLSEIGDYKDSQNLVAVNYKRYAGYYRDEMNEVNIHFQVYDGNKASIEFIRYDENGNLCKITEVGLLDVGVLDLKFTDSEGNFGNILISLLNEGLNIQIETTDQNSDVFIPDTSMVFPLESKSDAPISEDVSDNELVSFIHNLTTLNDLTRQGYELTFERTIYRSNEECLYRFVDSDVYVALYFYDLTTGERTDNPIVYAIMGPAEILYPELIGEDGDPFIENDTLVVPNGNIDIGGYIDLEKGYGYAPALTAFFSYEWCEVVEPDTVISMASKDTLGELAYQEMINWGAGYISGFEICPTCGKRYYLTGLGIDGLTCPRCGTNWMPMCYVCEDPDAVSIKNPDGEGFICNICGQLWVP